MVLESTSRPGQDARSSARWWGGLFLAVAGLSVLRLPRVRGHVERSVDDEIASGRLADTTQRALAVNLGVATALAVSVVALLVVLWIARWAGSAFGLPEVGSGPARVIGDV